MDNFLNLNKRRIMYIVAGVSILFIIVGMSYKFLNKTEIGVDGKQTSGQNQTKDNTKQVPNNGSSNVADKTVNTDGKNVEVKPGETQPVKLPNIGAPKSEFDKYLEDSKIDKYEVSVGADAKSIVQKYGQPQKKESIAGTNFWTYDKFILQTESFQNHDVVLSITSLDNSTILGIKKGMTKNDVVKKIGVPNSEGKISEDKFGEYKYLGVNIGDEYIQYKKKDSSNFDIQLFIYLNPGDKTVKKVRLM